MPVTRIDIEGLNADTLIMADTLNTLQTDQKSIANTELFGEVPGNKIEISPSALNNSHPDWIFLLLVLAMTIVVVVRIYFTKIFTLIRKHFISPSVQRTALREENVQIRQALALLSLNFYICGGLFLYLISYEFEWSSAWINSGFIRFMIFTLLLAVLFPLKILAIRMLGFIFDRLGLAESYVHNIQLTNNTLGLFLIPVCAVLAYVNWAYMNGLAVFITLFIILLLFTQILKGVLIWYNLRPFSLHYLIIYLCTLEIAPLLVIYKLTTF